MVSGFRLLCMIWMMTLLGSLSAYAQSTMPFSFLPPGFKPGESLLRNPADNFGTASTTTGVGSTLTTKVQPRYLSGKDFQFEYSFILLGLQQKSRYENFQIFSFRVYAEMKYRVAEDLVLMVSPFLIFRTGADQAPDGNSHNSTIFIVKDASMIWTPFVWWQLRGGILDENFYHSFMMLEDQSFPALRSTFYFGNGDLRGSLSGEQAILTFSSNTNTTNQIEETPTLQAVVAESHYNFTSRNKLKLSAGYWQYDNLPSSIAADAMLTGNTVTRQSDTFSVFAYKFHGLEARSRLELGLGPMDFNLYSEALVNDGAPKGMNTAWNAGTELMYRGSRNKKFGLNFEHFHVEPDAAVSVYNAFEYDRSNRNGIMVAPYIKWGKIQNKLSLRYVASKLIYENAPQSDNTQIRLRWETDYELL